MIKLTIGESKTQEVKPFPKLMASNEGRLVMMISYGIGFQLNYAANEDPHYYKEWAMNEFTDYNKPITLQNA